MDQWFLELQNPAIVHAVLFLLLIAGAVGFPIPEDIPLILGGIASHRGNITPLTTFFVCYSGVIIGDMIVFLIGRTLGPSLFEKKWFKARMSKRRMRRLKLRLEKRSLLMIFIARHLFYLRTMTFLTCGAVKMRASRFVFADSIAALISVPIMIWIGFAFSEHYETALGYVDELKFWSFIVGVPFLTYILIRFLRKKSPRETRV